MGNPGSFCWLKAMAIRPMAENPAIPGCILAESTPIRELAPLQYTAKSKAFPWVAKLQKDFL